MDIRENLKENWYWFLYLILMVSIVLFPIIGLVKDTARRNEETLLMKKQNLVDSINHEATILCNYEDLDKQDICMSRLIEKYKDLLKDVK